MSKSKKKRGRPRSANPATAAERMRAYRQRKKAAGLKSVRRWEPIDGDVVSRFSDHQILDARSLALHCAIAQKISRNPELLSIARENLDRWVAKTDTGTPRYLKAWRRVLERPWSEIAGLICSMNEEATRLRSSSPFAGVLSAEERERVYVAFRA